MMGARAPRGHYHGGLLSILPRNRPPGRALRRRSGGSSPGGRRTAQTRKPIVSTAQATQRRAQRFFSAASHDLRQPLQALSFYTNLVGLAPGQAEQRDLLARLAECADTLERQFNAISALPRRTRQSSVQRRAHRIGTDYAARSGGLFGRGRTTGLNLKIVSTRAIAMAVPDVLERVLSNLIGNAVRYTRKGGVVVGVRPQGGMLRVMVADSGIGVAAEYQTRIFEDFFQVSNPERNSAKGLGSDSPS